MRLKSELRSYQRRVIDYLYESPEALAVLKMGAGKTASVLTAIKDLHDDGVIRHALVIAPKRVATLVWPAEIEGWQHLCKLEYGVLQGDPGKRKLILDNARHHDITIIGIDNVQWLVDELKTFPDDHPIFDCLVIDETSRLKDPKSKRARALFSIAGRFKSRWGMTGTPRPNSLLDLHTQVKILTNGGLWPRSYYKWRGEHFYPVDRNGYDWRILPGHEQGLLRDVASISIALGENEMPDLPPLSILVDEVTLPPDARAHYGQMERRLFAELEEADILAVSRAVAQGKLAQAANGFFYGEGGNTDVHQVHTEKEDWLRELVASLDDEPCLLIYEYREDLAMIRRLFGDIPYLGAGVGDAQARESVEAWNRGEVPLFAIHPASGGHGLNLQAGGSRMAWVAPTWSPELHDQMIARLHRPGQAAHVMVHMCVATNTVDELKRLRVLSKLSAQEAFSAYLAGSRAGLAA